MSRTSIEMEYNISESLISTIMLFSREGSDNCVIVRSGGEQSLAVPIGHNENEPHQMSLETTNTREPSFWDISEGRRELLESSSAEVRCKQQEAVQHSGGVGGGSMSGSISRRSRETLLGGVETPTMGTTSLKREALWTLQGVRVLHSSDEAAVMAVERRRGTYVGAIHRRKGGGDGR